MTYQIIETNQKGRILCFRCESREDLLDQLRGGGFGPMKMPHGNPDTYPKFTIYEEALGPSGFLTMMENLKETLLAKDDGLAIHPTDPYFSTRQTKFGLYTGSHRNRAELDRAELDYWISMVNQEGNRLLVFKNDEEVYDSFSNKLEDLEWMFLAQLRDTPEPNYEEMAEGDGPKIDFSPFKMEMENLKILLRSIEQEHDNVTKSLTKYPKNKVEYLRRGGGPTSPSVIEAEFNVSKMINFCAIHSSIAKRAKFLHLELNEAKFGPHINQTTAAEPARYLLEIRFHYQNSFRMGFYEPNYLNNITMLYSMLGMLDYWLKPDYNTVFFDTEELKA